MSANTNRLDVIAQRQRTSRSRDLAFFILIAMLMIFQITGLRSAVAKSNRATATAKPAMSVPAQLNADGESCAPATPVC
jgi:hypothetical protein